jgi:hypothetical protein
MHYQEEFFLEGDETKLKPMILKTLLIYGGTRYDNFPWQQTTVC